MRRTAPTFSADDTDLLTSLSPALTGALCRAQAATFLPATPTPVIAGGPTVLILDDDLRPTIQTPSVEANLRALLPTSPGLAPVPAAAYNVAAQLLASEQGVDNRPACARAHLGEGVWISVRASRLESPSDTGARQIAVTIETIAPNERIELYGRASALTPRERQLLHELAAGSDTAGTAFALRISELTVQDHLKSIFRKTGTNSRQEVITRSLGTHR